MPLARPAGRRRRAPAPRPAPGAAPPNPKQDLGQFGIAGGLGRGAICPRPQPKWHHHSTRSTGRWLRRPATPRTLHNGSKQSASRIAEANGTWAAPIFAPRPGPCHSPRVRLPRQSPRYLAVCRTSLHAASCVSALAAARTRRRRSLSSTQLAARSPSADSSRARTHHARASAAGAAGPCRRRRRGPRPSGCRCAVQAAPGALHPTPRAPAAAVDCQMTRHATRLLAAPACIVPAAVFVTELESVPAASFRADL